MPDPYPDDGGPDPWADLADDIRRTRDTRIPPVRDPWTEDGDNLRPAKGIALGTALSIAAWVVLIAAGLAWALWL